MKLWLIKPVSEDEDTPWSPWYDKVFGFVVAAETKAEAVSVANDNCGNEGDVWADNDLVSCEELDIGDYKAAALILRDERRA